MIVCLADDEGRRSASSGVFVFRHSQIFFERDALRSLGRLFAEPHTIRFYRSLANVQR
jgi:hypothetical protein